MQKSNIKKVTTDKSIEGVQNGISRDNMHVIHCVNREKKLKHKKISTDKNLVQRKK